MVKTLCYMLESLEFDCNEFIEMFILLNSSNSTMSLGSARPLTEMSTRKIPGGKGRMARKADNLTAICEPTV
jgi:hypothetical protein